MGLDVSRYVLLACGCGAVAAAWPRRHGRGRGHPRPRQCLAPPSATAIPEFSCRSSPATIRPAIVPVSILLGGIGALGRPFCSGGSILPDAAVVVLQGPSSSWPFSPARRCTAVSGKPKGSRPDGRHRFLACGGVPLAMLAGAISRQHAVHLRERRRVASPSVPAASISVSKARW